MNPTRTGEFLIRSALSPVPRYQTSFKGVESMTSREQKDLVNINNIYAKTQRGEIVLGASVLPTFGDFSDQGTYDEILQRITEAKDAFFALPSEVRKQYNHDPETYYKEVMKEAKDNYDAGIAAKEALQAKEDKAKEIARARELLGINEDKD